MSETPDPTDETGSVNEDLVIRVPRGRVSGLRRRHVRLAVVALGAVVAAALIFGLGIDFHSHTTQDQHKIEPPRDDLSPLPVADLPSTYADVPHSKPPSSAEQLNEDESMSQNRSDAAHQTAPSGREEALRQELAHLAVSIQQVGEENQQLADQISAYQAAASQEQAKIWASGLFFKMDEAPARQTSESSMEQSADRTEPPSIPNDATARTEREFQEQQSNNGMSAPINAAQPPLSDQDRKLAFLNESTAPRLDTEQPILQQPPDQTSGVYQLQAGAVIPAALLTGVNTDLPGDVVATVTAPVYDSATGNYLLIPQGARLYGTYDSQITMSQDRALLVWRRLLFPNGRSVDLDRMRGTDAAGYSGVADQVDYHTDKLAAAAVLSGVIAYAGNLARDPQDLNSSAGDVVGDAVAQQASTIGSKIIDRELNVQPTITIRPGWPVRVLVNRDFDLPPYGN
jgi:type IV secretion system protein TrbI